MANQVAEALRKMERLDQLRQLQNVAHTPLDDGAVAAALESVEAHR